jgi:hypothetical protein
MASDREGIRRRLGEVVLYVLTGRFLPDLVRYYALEKPLYKQISRQIYDAGVRDAIQCGLLERQAALAGGFEVQRALDRQLRRIVVEQGVVEAKSASRESDRAWSDRTPEIESAAARLLWQYSPCAVAVMLDRAVDPLPPIGSRICQGLVAAILEAMERMNSISRPHEVAAARTLVRTMCLDPYQSPVALYRRVVYFLPREDPRQLEMAQLVQTAAHELHPYLGRLLQQKLVPGPSRWFQSPSRVTSDDGA